MDNRGSEEQRIIYRFLKDLYPSYDVIYEAVLPNGMRFDCFVKQIGLVIELDGIQHNQYVEHFHGDYNGFLVQRIKDRKKDSIAESLGIKLIRINQSDCPKSSDELKTLIDSIPYPDAEYDYNSITKQKDDKYLQAAKEVRSKRYLEMKNKKV